MQHYLVVSRVTPHVVPSIRSLLGSTQAVVEHISTGLDDVLAPPAFRVRAKSIMSECVLLMDLLAVTLLVCAHTDLCRQNDHAT